MKKIKNSMPGWLAKCAVVAAVLAGAMQPAGATTPLQVMRLADSSVYGYRDPATCVVWYVAQNSAASAYYYTAPKMIGALAWIEGATLAGFTDWRLPTLAEFQSVYAATTPVAGTAMLTTNFRVEGSTNGVPNTGSFSNLSVGHYWTTTQPTGTQVYAFVPSNGGYVPHSYSGGAQALIWAVRDDTLGCPAASASPFEAVKQ